MPAPSRTDPGPIRFAFADTRVGRALVAESARGVVAIFLGDNDARLHTALAEALPHANLVEDPAGMSDALLKAVALINAPKQPSDLPLDLRGSPVELAVWEALQAIPPGETRSYGQIAKALPIPATALEVGQACAANLVSVAVPCHRVVKADGSISGYRWGVHRKRRLLKAEAAA